MSGIVSLWIVPRRTGYMAYQVWPGSTLPPGCIQEAQDYWFELRGAAHPMEARLYVDETELEALRPPDSTTARWRWTPGFYAGSIELRLEPGDGARYEFELITDPDIRKLTRDQFDQMVQDILEDTLALFALSSHRVGIGRGNGGRLPPIARLEYLRTRMRKLNQVVQVIAKDPQHILIPEEKATLYYQTKRVSSSEILRSLRTGRVLKETMLPSRLPSGLRGFLPERVRHWSRRFSADTRENQDVKASLRTWFNWLQQIADLLEVRSNLASSNDQEGSQAALWAKRVRRMALQIGRLLDLPFFSEVADYPARPMATSVFRRVPIYRAFLELYKEFNLGIANVFGDFLNLPISRTYELYELWCFMRLLRAAVNKYGTDHVGLSELFSSVSAGAVTIPSGTVAVPLHSGLILAFQLSFREYWLEKGTGPGRQPLRGSFSREMIPDIILSGGAAGAGIVVLDAKYRINNAINDALSSIHMYRDALIQELCGKRYAIVRAAYLISPYVPIFSTSTGWRDESLPGRLFHPDYRSTFRFGALTLRPGMALESVEEALELLINDATS